jgi:hypothetical protein
MLISAYFKLKLMRFIFAMKKIILTKRNNLFAKGIVTTHKSCRLYLGLMLPPGGRNWKPIYPY